MSTVLPDLAELNRRWQAMSRWRRRTGMACGVLGGGLWCWTLGPQMSGLPPVWLCQLGLAFAGWVLLGTLASSELPGRRWHLGCALWLLATALELLLSGWLTQPEKPDFALFGALLQAQAQGLLSLRWVVGVPQWHGLFWWLMLPFIAVTLIAQNAQPALHPGMRRLAGWGAWTVLLALGLRLGYFFIQPDGLGVPTWGLVALLIGGVILGAGTWGYAGLPLLAGAVFGLIGRGLDVWHLGTPLLIGITTLALAITAVCWVYWWCRLPAIGAQQQARQAEVAARQASADAARAAAPPPSAAELQAHLDAQAAQEGADKYTRE